MRRRGFTMPVRLIAGLLTGLSLAIVAISFTAQPAFSATQHPLALGYDKAHEITLNGTVAEVVTKPTAGSPVGLHLVVTGSQGKVDAHVGPYMAKEIQEALHAGTPVQIVGAMEKLHGKDYLLARQVIFSGRLVQVRNENGLLVRVDVTPKSHHGLHKSGIASKGGAR